MLPEIAIPIINAMRRLHPGKRFELGGMDAPVLVPADPVSLAELLSILLDNAGKWARETVRLDISRADCDRLMIAIHDDGPRMSEEQIGRACGIGGRFDPSMPGSGLGLAIGLEICNDNRGATGAPFRSRRPDRPICR